MHIPQGSQPVAGVVLQEATEPGGVGKDAAGLQQDAHAQGLGLGQQGGDAVKEGSFGGFIALRCPADHIGDPQIPGGGEHILQNVGIFRRAGQVQGGVQAGDGELLIPQITEGGGQLVAVEGTAPVRQGGVFVEVVDLDAGEFHFQGGVQPGIPAQAAPAAGGKGEFHTVSSS